MAIPSSRFPPELLPVQVWTQLDPERRQQAIALVARMAFNFVILQSQGSQQEVFDAHATHPYQAP